MDLGPIALSVALQDGAATVRRQIGTVDYTSSDWLAKESGIAVIPVPLELRAACATSPLTLMATAGAGNILARESRTGMHVRAENLVARLDPGSNDAAYPSKIGVRFFASSFGVPFAGSEDQHLRSWAPR